MQAVPRILTPEEMKAWGLPQMIPIFPSDKVLAVEGKWSKRDLQDMAIEYFLDPVGDKELLVHKLLYVGALDKEGERTELPVEAPDIVPYVIDPRGEPTKFCCRICGECAPPDLLKPGEFFERMEWLREHYKKVHPGLWGKHASRVIENLPVTVKKAWEMTQAEFYKPVELPSDWKNRGYKPVIEKRRAGRTRIVKVIAPDGTALVPLDDFGITWARAKYGSVHEQVVKNALEGGLPVPPEVLADYPQLKRYQRQ